MIAHTDDYIAQVKSNGRQFDFYLDIYGNAAEPTSISSADLISISIDRACSDGVQIGACMSDRISFKTRATNLFNGRLKKLKVYYRCTAPETPWVALGTFYVDKAYTEYGITTVTGYDMMGRLDKVVKWVDRPTATAPVFPCTQQEVLDYVCGRAAVTTDFVCQPFAVESAPDGYTARELISYIAASHGANARFSADEVLQIKPYTQTGITIDRNRCYDVDVAVDGGTSVQGILFDLGGDTQIYIDGDGGEYDSYADGIIECYNPLATVEIAEYAWSQLGGMSCASCSAEMPAENILEPGDMFTISDSQGNAATGVVMQQQLSVSYNGGFAEKLASLAENKNNQRTAGNRITSVESNIQSISPKSDGYSYGTTVAGVGMILGETIYGEVAEDG